MQMQPQEVCPTTPLQMDKHMQNNRTETLSYTTDRN